MIPHYLLIISSTKCDLYEKVFFSLYPFFFLGIITTGTKWLDFCMRMGKTDKIKEIEHTKVKYVTKKKGRAELLWFILFYLSVTFVLWIIVFAVRIGNFYICKHWICHADGDDDMKIFRFKWVKVQGSDKVWNHAGLVYKPNWIRKGIIWREVRNSSCLPAKSL